MSKSFLQIRTHLGLKDFFQFGKYRGCRVDSIVDMDDDYLRYMQKQGMKFDTEVVSALAKKFSPEFDQVGYDPRDHQEVDENYRPISFDDVPW